MNEPQHSRAVIGWFQSSCLGTSRKYLQDYEVEVVFNDGKSGVADLAPALHGPVFEPLKDNAVFAKLQVDKELETIVWPNGADLAPEYIYFLAFKNNPEMQGQFAQWGFIGP